MLIKIHDCVALLNVHLLDINTLDFISNLLLEIYERVYSVEKEITTLCIELMYRRFANIFTQTKNRRVRSEIHLALRKNARGNSFSGI